MKFTKVKIIMFLVLVFIVSCSLLGCGDPSITSDNMLSKATEKTMVEMNAQIGMPAIINFQERKLAKEIFELRDKEDLITYAYIVNHMTGKFIFIGKCIGYGLPYSIQYTSPEKLIRKYSGGEYYIVPQADPNGLFPGSGLSATWLMMIDPSTNEPRATYIEQEIFVSPFPRPDLI